mmetsp:Transcript_4991/g.20009  ORF Transcript_4991/g.20009 Transcript_4991/m.20009 type:complete len:349 (+) Transcript_4991:396-1442(+)
MPRRVGGDARASRRPRPGRVPVQRLEAQGAGRVGRPGRRPRVYRRHHRRRRFAGHAPRDARQLHGGGREHAVPAPRRAADGRPRRRRRRPLAGGDAGHAVARPVRGLAHGRGVQHRPRRDRLLQTLRGDRAGQRVALIRGGRLGEGSAGPPALRRAGRAQVEPLAGPAVRAFAERRRRAWRGAGAGSGAPRRGVRGARRPRAQVARERGSDQDGGRRGNRLGAAARLARRRRRGGGGQAGERRRRRRRGLEAFRFLRDRPRGAQDGLLALARGARRAALAVHADAGGALQAARALRPAALHAAPRRRDGGGCGVAEQEGRRDAGDSPWEAGPGVPDAAPQRARGRAVH